MILAGITLADSIGEAVHVTESCVIRVHETLDGVHVYVHPVIDRVEHLPVGYLSGSNSLTYVPKRSHSSEIGPQQKYTHKLGGQS